MQKNKSKALNAAKSSGSATALKNASKDTNCNVKIKKTQQKAIRITNRSDAWQTIPAICYVLTILLVRIHASSHKFSQFFWTSYTDSTTVYDFFSYFKMIGIVISAVLAICITALWIVTAKPLKNIKILYIPMALYTVFVILSYITSDYKDFALLGWYNRNEGLITLVCYMIMLWFIINAIDSEKKIIAIISAIVTASGLLGILGFAQARGYDPFSLEWGQLLISSAEYKDAVRNAFANGQAAFGIRSSTGTAYLTVFNVNYVAFIESLFIPFEAALFVYSYFKFKSERQTAPEAKNNTNTAKGRTKTSSPSSAAGTRSLVQMIILAALFALSEYSLIACKSSGGYIGLAAFIIVAIIVLNKRLLQVIRPLAALVIITASIFAATTDRWIPEIEKGLKSFSLLGTFDVYAGDLIPMAFDIGAASQKPYVDYINTGDDCVEMSLNGNVLYLKLYDDALDALDNEKNPLELFSRNDYYIINDERYYPYAKISFTYYNDNLCVIVTTDDTDWCFTKVSGTYYFINPYKRLVKLYKDSVESFGFENKQALGTGRGYIYSRTIPLLKYNIITGVGPDCFIMAFPNQDYPGKYNSAQDADIKIVTDKAHCLYLGTGVNTGVISMLALIALYGIYVVSSIRLYIKRDLFSKYPCGGNNSPKCGDNENRVSCRNPEFLVFIGMGCLFASVGFMGSALVNDSSTSTMPMFYTVMGLGIAVNEMVKHRECLNAA